ncbi:hypothetical protein Hamer_G011746 [Homarus americanus]|uniref:Uncharacterized protein n=1 Tax=Homarus americanus TaxID=6706 RepID=A0A8J5K7J6_HOMAM|nr:hypothetical protein Hamer_G011746 [Homarus americanus]
MKIHSGQPMKIIQPTAPPCKVQFDAPAVSNTPGLCPPECQVHEHTHRSSRTGTTTQQQRTRPDEKEPREVLDYRECWHMLQGEEHRHTVQECPERHKKSQEPPGTASSRAREVEVLDQRQDSGWRGGQRVRQYRKRLSVRWGSLQWSLALVLVVRSRSSSGSCQHSCRHHHTSPGCSSPLTVA